MCYQAETARNGFIETCENSCPSTTVFHGRNNEYSCCAAWERIFATNAARVTPQMHTPAGERALCALCLARRAFSIPRTTPTSAVNSQQSCSAASKRRSTRGCRTRTCSIGNEQATALQCRLGLHQELRMQNRSALQRQWILSQSSSAVYVYAAESATAVHCS